MARDAHPADDAAANPHREAGPAGWSGVTVTGNPTARELTAVLAAVRAARRRRPTTAPDTPRERADGAASGSDSGPGPADAAEADTDRAEEASDSPERVAHERRCPVCRERYDSARPLEGPTSLRTAERGASTVCVDPGSRRVYVHSPPPR